MRYLFPCVCSDFTYSVWGHPGCGRPRLEGKSGFARVSRVWWAPRWLAGLAFSVMDLATPDIGNEQLK